VLYFFSYPNDGTDDLMAYNLRAGNKVTHQRSLDVGLARARLWKKLDGLIGRTPSRASCVQIYTGIGKPSLLALALELAKRAKEASRGADANEPLPQIPQAMILMSTSVSSHFLGS
jgi:hypothetical protein